MKSSPPSEKNLANFVCKQSVPEYDLSIVSNRKSRSGVKIDKSPLLKEKSFYRHYLFA